MQFKRVYVEITNACNLNCSFCPKNVRKKQFISTQNFEYVLNQISPLTNNIHLHVMGEPLLHPNLLELVNLACNKNFTVNITTNGTLLTNEICKNLAGKIRKLTISLHSYEANNIGINLTDYVTNCIKCAKEFAEKGTFVEFRLWNNNSQNIVAKNSLNEQIISILKTEFNYHEEICTAKKNHTLQDNVFLGFDNVFEWPENSKNAQPCSHKFCFALRSHFAILVDGTVVPCCLDNNGALKLGNIYEQNITNILKSNLANSIYNGFSNRIATQDFCKTCTFVNKFDK